MQAGPVKRLVELLAGQNWSVLLGEPVRELSGQLLEYPQIHQFAKQVRRCVSEDEQVWFLGSEDFLDDTGDGWNFIEQQISRPSADGDEEWTSQVARFWEQHLPLALNVRGDYAVLGIDRQGRVWEGVAPDLEEPTLVAESFEAFVGELERQTQAQLGPLYVQWVRGSSALASNP